MSKKTITKAKIIKNMDNARNLIIQEAKALIQMYQAGFQDGRRAKAFKGVSEACKKAFDKRFKVNRKLRT